MARLFLTLLFFLSGAAGLIYEVVWSRYLSLIIGNTTQSHMIVLSTFLGGLALGNYGFGRWNEKILSPVRWYGWMEIGVSVWCACYIFIHRWIIGLKFIWSLPPSTQLIVHSILCVFVLLVPTILMGGTFPVLINAFAKKTENSHREIGFLYAVNSFGAVCGSLLASLVLIEKLGIDFTILIGAGFSATVGLCALLFPEKCIRPPILAEPAETELSRSEVLPSSFQIVSIYGAVFLSGFYSLILEIGWFRFFALILGSTLHSFALMLAAFILGITLGSIVISRKNMKTFKLDWVLAYVGYCHLAVCCSLWITFLIYPRLPYYFVKFISILNRSEETFWIFQGSTFLFCFILMLIPTFFLGMALPLASQWIAHYKGQLGKGVGETFSLNLFGTILGAFTAGLFLLPWFGIQGTLTLASGIALLTGVIVLVSSPKLISKLNLILIGSIFLFFCFYVKYKNDWKGPLVGISSVIGRNIVYDSYDEFQKNLSQSKLLYYKDGTQSTIAVLENQDKDRILKINGKTDASVYGDLPTELLLGHLPMLLRPERLEKEQTQSLCIGFGSGITAGAILQYPNTRLDLVEISPEVMEAAPLFSDHNHEVLKNPALRIVLDDAKSYLLQNSKKYDLIISEPSNPRLPGIANLFTKEFFEAARDHLTPDGLMAQWFHLYSMDDDTVRMILRTFQTVYPYVHIWNPEGTDVILLGSMKPLAVNFELLKKRMMSADVKKDFARIHLFEPAALLFLEVLSSPWVELIAGLGPLHTDYFPRLEFGATKSLYAGTVSKLLDQYDQRSVPHSRLLLQYFLGNRELTWAENKNIALYIHRLQNRAFFNSALFPSVLEKMVSVKKIEETDLQDQRVAVQLLAQWYDRRGEWHKAMELLSPLLNKPETPFEAHLFYIELLFKEYERKISSVYQPDPKLILNALNQTVQKYPQKKGAYLYWMAKFCLMRRETEQVKKLLIELKEFPDQPVESLLKGYSHHL